MIAGSLCSDPECEHGFWIVNGYVQTECSQRRMSKGTTHNANTEEENDEPTE